MKMRARRTFLYEGMIRRPGEPVNVREGDVQRLESGGLAVRVRPAAPPSFDASKASRGELEAEATRRGIEVVGTGKDGAVLVGDLRKALG